MRYLPGVPTNITAACAGRTFLILAVLNEDERNRQLTLLTKEINDQ